MTPPCPRCTFYRRDHSELAADILAFPVFGVGRHGLEAGRPRWLVKEGCQHARQLDDGEFETEAAIERAWQDIVDGLS